MSPLDATACVLSSGVILAVFIIGVMTGSLVLLLCYACARTRRLYVVLPGSVKLPYVYTLLRDAMEDAKQINGHVLKLYGTYLPPGDAQ